MTVTEEEKVELTLRGYRVVNKPYKMLKGDRKETVDHWILTLGKEAYSPFASEGQAWTYAKRRLEKAIADAN